MRVFKPYLVMFLSLVLIMTLIVPVFSQIAKNKLVFSEVFLDKEKPQKSWLEVFNPTSEALVLYGFRISHVYTSNLLPKAKKSTYQVKPGEYLLLCANERVFRENWGEIDNLVVVPGISSFIDGGFIALYTNNNKDKGVDAFRYGRSEKSKKYETAFGTQVLEFTANGKSWIRNIEIIESSTKILDFQESAPTPGKKNY
ncbi:hypothetical protein ACFL6G_06580 [candidate division KSB1 bacterium]